MYSIIFNNHEHNFFLIIVVNIFDLIVYLITLLPVINIFYSINQAIFLNCILLCILPVIKIPIPYLVQS